MIRYETLKSFCAKEEEKRQALKYAVRINDRWYASDSYVGICVPMEHCEKSDIRFQMNEIPEVAGRYPNIEAVMRYEEFKPTHTLDLRDLEALEGKLPQVPETKKVEKEIHYIDCPECDNGEIELSESIRFKHKYYSVEAKAECPICHGYGKIPDWDDYNPKEMEYDPDVDKTSYFDKPTGNTIPDSKALVSVLGAFVTYENLVRLLDIAKDTHTRYVECTKGDNVIKFMLSGVMCIICTVFVDDKENKDFVELKSKQHDTRRD